jgi:hypothetical protein
LRQRTARGLERALDTDESRRITRLLASYCHYHAGTTAPGKALDFVCDMMGQTA